MASHGRPDRGGMDVADRMPQRSGDMDAADADFKEHYDACLELMSEIASSVEGLTYAHDYTPSAPAPARDLRRKRNERVIDSDGSLKPFPLRATAASLIAEDLVPPDYRVRTS